MPISNEAVIPVPVVSSSTARMRWMDVARGIGIVLVVYGHALRVLVGAGLISPADPLWVSDYVIYTFHMPLFFLLSGMNVEQSLRKGKIQFLRSKLWTIAYPYLLWSLIQGSIQILFASHLNTPLHPHSLATILWRPIGEFWFIYVLFIFQLIGMIFARTRIPLALLAIAAYVGSFYLPANIWERVAHMLIFFAVGILFTKTIRLSLERIRFVVLPLSILAFAFLAFIGRNLSNSNADSPLSLPATAAGIAMVLVASQYVVQTTEPATRLLSLLGLASMAIYVLHVLVGSGSRVALHMVGIHSIWIYLVVAVVLGVAIPALIFSFSVRLGIARIMGLGSAAQRRPIPTAQ